MTLFLKLPLLWGLAGFLYVGVAKKTYTTLENGLLSQCEKWQKVGEAMIKEMTTVRVAEVGFVPPAGKALCVVGDTRDKPEAITFDILYYSESELIRLLNDLKTENPNIQYDAETYAIMQGRSKYYHGLVNPFTEEFVGDDRDPTFRNKDKWNRNKVDDQDHSPTGA